VFEKLQSLRQWTPSDWVKQAISPNNQRELRKIGKDANGS